MPLLYLTRRERFNAAHKLWNPDWSSEKNRNVFGKCANENWHGHNYELFVTIVGEPARDTGYVADLKVVGEIIHEKVIEKLDHKNLNLDVDFMTGLMSSTENLAVAIWKELESNINALGCSLYSVRIKETENNEAEYRGE